MSDINITIDTIGNALSVAWSCEQFHTLRAEIDGMQNLINYSSREAYDELNPYLQMLWEVALERSCS